jgi:hypothetical protein
MPAIVGTIAFEISMHSWWFQTGSIACKKTQVKGAAQCTT